MWFLEHETLFGGKRVWLRPGSQHLFGRTKPSSGDGAAGKNVFIDNKNVSRKHMTIKVLDVSPADGTKLHKRSQIEIADFSCRQGTTVDDKTLKSTKEADGTITEDKITLSGIEHTVKLSSSYPAFTVRWQDVVFTYATKEKKGASQSQATTRNAELHAMDIKTASEYLHGKTTHVVSQKRNLPKVLEALVSGIPIVTTEYLDAILSAAARSTDSEGNSEPSQLEEDFDAWWPQEKEYIPRTGAEPVPRPDQMLAPDASRSELFSGLTFVFLNEAQHSTLHQVVASGGGKALLYDFRPGETTVEEYVDYVKSVAGQKKRGRVANTALPVVTVRPTIQDDLAEWATDFVTGVDRTLNQRSIVQNEFLDAIITKDISSLRRPPTQAELPSSSIPTPGHTQRSLQEPTPLSQSREPSQALEASSVPAKEPTKMIPRKRPARRAVTSRFTGFDDYEPPRKSRKIEEAPVEEASVEDALMEDVQQPVPDFEPSTQSQIPPETQTQRTTRTQPKRDGPASLEKLFPTAEVVKKRREATQPPTVAVAVNSAAPTTQTPAKPPTAAKPTIMQQLKAKQREREAEMKLDLKAKDAIRKAQAEDEDRRRLAEEQLRADLEGVDISKLHVSVPVLPCKIRPREYRISARTQSQGTGEGWNPDWNGRKNFKGFKRKGTERDERGQSQKIIVGLKAAPPRKGFGDSMVMNEEVPERTEADERRLKRRLGTRVHDSEEERPIGFQRRKKTKPTPAPPVEVIDVEDSGPEEEEVPGTSASTIRGSGRTQRVVETQIEDVPTQGSSRKRLGGPLSFAAGQPVAKKSRAAKKNEDSDNEEGGFRFPKRKTRV